jgi:hypothetical protein
MRVRKRFGQHFLHDQGVLRRIVAAVDPQPGQHVVEIGPGAGALTAHLLDSIDALDAVEMRLISTSRRFRTSLAASCGWSATCPTTSPRRCCFIFSSIASASSTCT